jgi:structural maintenance of chromosome 2
LTSQRKSRETTSSKNADNFAKRRAELEALTSSLSQSEDLLQTIEYGKGLSKDAKSSGYDGQLAAAKELAGTLETEAQLGGHRIESLRKELKEKEPKAKKAAAESAGLIGNVDKARKEKEDLEARLRESGYDEAEEARLEGEREQRMQTLEQLRQVSWQPTLSEFLFSAPSC